MTLRIGRTIAESTPAFDPLPRRPEGAPNVVVIVLDDLGFAQLGCFGSDIATPDDRRASPPAASATTASTSRRCARRRARACSPGATTTPSAWASSPTSRPASPATTAASRRPRRTLPRILRDAGYSTFAVGKWHLAPRWERARRRVRSTAGRSASASSATTASSAATPTSGRPSSSSDNAFVEPPRAPEEGYHLTEDLADRAIRMIQDQQQATPDQPFFLYFATGAMHAPHHAPQEWIDRYRGRFDDGWDAWRDELFARQRRGRHRAAGHARSPSGRAGCAAWDDIADGRAPPLRPADGGVRRASSPTPTTRSAGSSTSSS